MTERTPRLCRVIREDCSRDGQEDSLDASQIAVADFPDLSVHLGISGGLGS